MGRKIFETIKEVKGLFLLLLTLLLSAGFQLTREDGAMPPVYPDDNPFTHTYFLFSKVELYRDTYWYFLLEHAIQLIMAIYLLSLTSRFKTAFFIFMLIHLFDTIDYLLAYGEAWFEFGTYPIGWNVLKVVALMLAIANEVFLISDRKLQSG